MLALLNLMIRPKYCSRHTTLFTTLMAATNPSSKATTPPQEISFSEYGDLGARRRGCPPRLPPGRRSLTPRSLKLSFELHTREGTRLSVLRLRKAQLDHLGTSMSSKSCCKMRSKFQTRAGPNHLECDPEKYIENKIDR
jgi:hypothetical protein